MDLIQKLGLEKIDERNVRYADNSVKRKEAYGLDNIRNSWEKNCF